VVTRPEDHVTTTAPYKLLEKRKKEEKKKRKTKGTMIQLASEATCEKRNEGI